MFGFTSRPLSPTNLNQSSANPSNKTQKHLLKLTKKPMKAFSLIEVSIALLIIGLTSISGLYLFKSFHKRYCIQITKKRQEMVLLALGSFATHYGYLPYPCNPRESHIGKSVPFDTLTEENWSTVQYIGIIPWRTLNLPKEVIYDGYGNLMTYCMHPLLGRIKTHSFVPNLDYYEYETGASLKVNFCKMRYSLLQMGLNHSALNNSSFNHSASDHSSAAQSSTPEQTPINSHRHASTANESNTNESISTERFTPPNQHIHNHTPGSSRTNHMTEPMNKAHDAMLDIIQYHQDLFFLMFGANSYNLRIFNEQNTSCFPVYYKDHRPGVHYSHKVCDCLAVILISHGTTGGHYDKNGNRTIIKTDSNAANSQSFTSKAAQDNACHAKPFNIHQSNPRESQIAIYLNSANPQFDHIISYSTRFNLQIYGGPRCRSYIESKTI